MELILDANRNSLLGLDLKVSIATLGLTSGALVAGLFGMVRLALAFQNEVEGENVEEMMEGCSGDVHWRRRETVRARGADR